MKAKDITNIYKARLKKLSLLYQKVLEGFDMNDIHHFRVEIKKLRAFMRLMNSRAPEHQQKLPKELKKFYNITGNLRNLQLHQQLIEKLADDLPLEVPDQYLQTLRDDENFLRRKAQQVATKISLKEFERRLIDASDVHLTQQIKTVFVQKNKERIAVLLTLTFYYDEALHSIRKVTKDLMYTYKYLKKIIDIEFPLALLSVKQMEQLTATLGDFHDLCVAFSLLGPIYTERTGRTEVRGMDNFRGQIQLRKDAMKKEILQLLAPIKKEMEAAKREVQH